MTALLPALLQRIRAGGPITVADYMQECLLNPDHGYYATRDPFGAGGDFTTAPEISQMFGEMLGLSLAQAWLDQRCPTPFLLAEPGPGRGTLMADILRATRGVPGFHSAAELHLIEASATLRNVQRATLADYGVHWHSHIAELPQAPLFLIANEFFDALPIRQFIRVGNGWRERRVGETDGQLQFGTSEVVPVPALDHRLGDTSDGDLVETCAAGSAIAAEIATRIATSGGAAVFVDYGGWHSKGDTFQALKDHAFCDVLESPGDADLTAHVDFEPLAEAGLNAGLAVSGLTPQGVLLERLGIATRAQSLATKLTGAALETHLAAHRRLTHPKEMGTLFKALALYPATAPLPAGFTASTA